MKKAILIILTATLLLTSLASCSRRGQYEDVLESQKEAESLDAIPETNGNITGDSAPDYATPVMLITGSTPFYEGKTTEDLIAVYKSTGHDLYFPNMTPTGRLYDGSYTNLSYYYNKLTGNFSNWCSDPLCEHDVNCIWSMGIQIQYVSDHYIYFYTGTILDEYGIYRCDFQRNNIEKVKDVARHVEGNSVTYDEVSVLYEKDDVLYFHQFHYINGNSVGSIYTLDMNTKEEACISGDVDIQFAEIANNQIFYSTSDNWYTLYKTDLDFSAPELFWEDVYIDQYNDQYMILNEKKGETSSVHRYSYNFKTGERYTLNDIYGGVSLSGEYIYHFRDLTEEEMKDDPLKDYYTYTWYREARPGASVIHVMDADTQTAGKIYRTYVGANNASEECVFQLTYKGIPVRINKSGMEMDGEVIYFNFNTHETCKNFYNQEFEGDERQTAIHALVDLQNGTVTFLELPKEEE